MTNEEIAAMLTQLSSEIEDLKEKNVQLSAQVVSGSAEFVRERNDKIMSAIAEVTGAWFAENTSTPVIDPDND